MRGYLERQLKEGPVPSGKRTGANKRSSLNPHRTAGKQAPDAARKIGRARGGIAARQGSSGLGFQAASLSALFGRVFQWGAT